MSMSVDGFVAGPNQSLVEPLGERVAGRLHRWMFEQPEANAGAIEEITAAGAYIMGRNMGAWDEGWRGWWARSPNRRRG
jgi:hypothetical protein